MIKKIIYTSNNTNETTLRQLLQEWLIPKKWQHFLRVNHNVLINGSYQPFNYVLQFGDEITLIFDFPPRTPNQNYLASKIPLKIIFEDSNILIVYKKSGQKSHPNSPIENDSLMNSAEYYLSKNNHHPYMIHRLDKETSGLMMIAKNPYVVPILNRQLTNKIFTRQYLAKINLFRDIPNSGYIEYKIGPDPNDKRKRMVTNDGLFAKTKFDVLQKNSDFAIVKLTLFTGRTHQIRVHLSHNHWPIINDPLYNPSISDGNMKLTAFNISYIKPFSNIRKTVQIDIENEYQL